MITLQTLNWSDCFSYGPNNSLTLDKDPIVQLVGKNGHGKSSIGLLLEEVCYNKNSKGTKRADVLNRYSNAKKYSIELTFNKDGDTYKIETVRGASSSTKLTKNGIDISSHTATGTLKLIEEVIGLDSSSFAQLIYQSSASSLEFLTATDTNRKKFLINLLNLEHYTKAHDTFKELVKTVNTDVVEITAKINTNQSWLDKAKSSDLSIKELEEVPVVKELDLRAELIQIENLTESLTNIEATNKKITRNNEYKALQAKIPLEELSVELPVVKDVSKESEEYAGIQHTIKSAKSFISKMGKLNDKCPTCSHEIDNTKARELLLEQETQIRIAEERGTELFRIIEAAEQDRKWVERVANYKTEYENYNALIDPTMPEALQDKRITEQTIKNLKDEIHHAQRNIKLQQEAVADIIAKNTKIAAHNTKVEVITEQMAAYSAELLDLGNKLSVLETRLATLQLLQKTFSTNGLVAYKIECMVKDLQNLTNQYLAELSDGRFQINFVMGASDKLNVVIVDNGTEIDISALSSGERARVNTATLLAIRKLMQTLSAVRINLLVLDETIDNLDVDGKERLVEVLLKEEHLNTILVSHGYSHPLIEKVSVIKENNISRIE
jgi:DNA repair exonuclease SbcCD ATPase subunit